MNVIYFLFCISVSGPQLLIYSMRSFGLDLKCLKNSVINMEEEEAKGCDHKRLLVDSKFRSKLWLFRFPVELERSLNFTSGGNLLPPPELASVKYECS